MRSPLSRDVVAWQKAQRLGVPLKIPREWQLSQSALSWAPLSGKPVEKWSKLLLPRAWTVTDSNTLNISAVIRQPRLIFDLNIAEVLGGMATCAVGTEVALVNIILSMADVALL